jgi:hypothetical protein
VSEQPKVHLDRDGRARCGRRPGVQVTADQADVTCGFCLNLVNGTHAIGNRQPDEPCGTASAYRRHYRNGEKPCRPCKQAESRRGQDSPAKKAYNARRRERYSAARAAGLTAREANRRKSLRRAA